MVGGDPLEALYLWHGLANETRESYTRVVGAFEAFCRLRGYSFPYWPATADRVGAWIAAEAHRTITSGGALYKKTLKTKLYALSSWHKDLGFSSDGVLSPRVQRVIAGANRYHGVIAREQPLPITLPILRKMIAAINEHPALYGGAVTSLALVAAFTLGFACFMRMGELTYKEFDERFDLRRASVTFGASGLPELLLISASKTDPFRIGVTAPIPTGPPDVCPALALSRYMRATSDRPSNGPLFTMGSSATFEKTQVVRYMSQALREAGYQASRFTGHSLRRGAATWAASIGMSATQIKTLGRWSSEAYRLYIDAGPEPHRDAGLRLLHAQPADSSLAASGIPLPGQVWRPAL